MHYVEVCVHSADVRMHGAAGVCTVLMCAGCKCACAQCLCVHGDDVHVNGAGVHVHVLLCVC